jgi:hypothetical protein
MFSSHRSRGSTCPKVAKSKGLEVASSGPPRQDPPGGAHFYLWVALSATIVTINHLPGSWPDPDDVANSHAHDGKVRGLTWCVNRHNGAQRTVSVSTATMLKVSCCIGFLTDSRC